MFFFYLQQGIKRKYSQELHLGKGKWEMLVVVKCDHIMIQYGAVIMQVIYSKIIAKDTP